MKKISTKVDDELALLLEQEIAKTQSTVYQFLQEAIEEKLERDKNSEIIDEFKITLTEHSRRLEKTFEEKTIKLLEVTKSISDIVVEEMTNSKERDKEFRQTIVGILKGIDQRLTNKVEK